jgi:hypothetical protein
MGRIEQMLASTGKSSLIAFRTMVNPDTCTTRSLPDLATRISPEVPRPSKTQLDRTSER